MLAANGLAALGGCWWPIEVTPQLLLLLVATALIAMLAARRFQYQIERSPFMGNVRDDSRWVPWLTETREMMSEDLVLSFR